jgi:hypothetical protein
MLPKINLTVWLKILTEETARDLGIDGRTIIQWIL